MRVKPVRLETGDRVGIFAPSSPVSKEFRDRGVREIREIGFIPVEAPDILSGSGDYISAAPGKTVEDMRSFFKDRSVKALWAARGGYGSNLSLNALSVFSDAEPRVIIGSSDVSYLLWALMDIMNMTVFYGPMVFSAMADGRYDRNNLLQVLKGDYDELRIPGRVLKKGRAGRMVTGGCLSNLVSLCGTKFFPQIKGRVVLIEDVNERPYRLDRMLWQLSECGFFSKVGGIIFGEFPGCFLDDDEKSVFYRRISNYFAKYDYPVLYDLPFGHASSAKTLPLGVKVSINTSEYEGIVIREKAVSGT